jgi:hypothetical protein
MANNDISEQEWMKAVEEFPPDIEMVCPIEKCNTKFQG